MSVQTFAIHPSIVEIFHLFSLDSDEIFGVFHFQAVAYIHSRHPSSVLVAVSEGSGSGILLSYLGECGSSSYLTAAAAISPVLLGQLWFETAMPPIYRWGALFHRKLQLSR